MRTYQTNPLLNRAFVGRFLFGALFVAYLIFSLYAVADSKTAIPIAPNDAAIDLLIKADEF